MNKRFLVLVCLVCLTGVTARAQLNRMTVRDNEFRFDVINNFGLGVVVNLGKL